MKKQMKTKEQLVEELSILRREMAELKRPHTGRKRAEEAIKQAVSLLTSTLESTADGILVIDDKGKVTTYNKKFLSMWRIPESLAEKRDDKILLDYVLSQLKDPEGFIEKVKQLYSRQEAESFDVLEFRDGRVFERFSQPQRLVNKITGRVWSFRDVTDRRRAEEEQRRDRESAGRLAGEIAVIAEIGRLISSTLDIEEVYERFAAEARKLIPFDSLIVNLKKPREDTLDVAYASGADIPERRKGDSFPLKGSVSEFAMHTRTGLIVRSADILKKTGRFSTLGVNIQAGMHSMMSAPLISRDEAIGALVFRAEKQNAYTEQDLRLAERIVAQIVFLPHRYTQTDVEMLNMLGTQAAIAIRNARLYNKIEQVAVTDELTGLFNRRGFFQLGEREFERALRFSRPLAALMFDIDHFKIVNDTHGHPAGDQVLRALADCVRQNTRGIDVAGRYGGEEFVLLLPEILLPGAIQLAQRLHQSIADLSIPICQANSDSPPVDIHITVSIGIAAWSQDVQSLTGMLYRADHALYCAKNSGRNRVVVWEEKENLNP